MTVNEPTFEQRLDEITSNNTNKCVGDAFWSHESYVGFHFSDFEDKICSYGHSQLLYRFATKNK